MQWSILGRVVTGTFLSLLVVLLPVKSIAYVEGDINSDNKIGLEETIYSLKVLSDTAIPLSGTTINVPGDIPTIQQAIDAASDGDTINIAAGTYNEALEINNKILTLSGAGSASTIIDATIATVAENGITIERSPGVAINNLTIQNGVKGIYALYNSHVEIDQVIVKDCTDHGIQIDNNSNAEIRDSTIDNAGRDGINLYGNSNAYITGTVTTQNNARRGMQLFLGSTGLIDQATFTSSGNNDRGVHIADNSSLYASNSNISLLNNNRGIQAHNSSSLGIYGSTITINNNERGILISNSSSFSSSFSTITFESNSRWGLQLVGASSVYTAPDTSMTIHNSDRGFQLHGSSYAEITGALLVEDSGNIGIFVTANSTIEIGEPADITVRSSVGDGDGISIVDGSSVWAEGGSLIVENNTRDGIRALRNSRFGTGENFSAQIRNNGRRGVSVDDGSTANCSNSTITGNTGGDVVLSFGSHASLYGGTVGTISCDGTVFSRGDHVCP